VVCKEGRLKEMLEDFYELETFYLERRNGEFMEKYGNNGIMCLYFVCELDMFVMSLFY
jgi:hypothetical protein